MTRTVKKHHYATDLFRGVEIVMALPAMAVPDTPGPIACHGLVAPDTIELFPVRLVSPDRVDMRQSKSKVVRRGGLSCRLPLLRV